MSLLNSSQKDENMKHFKAIAVASVLSLGTSIAHSYDVTDRYKLIDDKLKTEQMLRPIGHDFFLDIGAALNKNVTDVVKDISNVSKITGIAAQLTEAQRVLTKYDKTEQTVKINVALGFPVFRFSVGELKVQPNIRVMADAGANIGIRTDILTPSAILDLFNFQLPADLKAQVLAHTYTAGDDLLQPICGSLTDPISNALCLANVGKYFYPDPTVPDMFLFAKIDGRFGFYNDYTYGEHFFGNWNLYGLSRTDIFQRVGYKMIAKGSKIELPNKKNTEMALQTDYRLGYQNSNYRVFTSVEDIKLSKLKEKDAGAKDHTYGYDPLIRLHADAMYKFSVLSLNPFLGVHKRSGYGFADGMYVGADAGAHVWGDRLGLQLRGMVDKQYFTISPRLKLWLLQLEYSLKAPMKSMDGDVKLSALHSVDLRLFF